MAQRLELQTLLETLTDHVYFQPPPNFQMEYPCLIYSRDGSSNDHADNEIYRHAKRYQVTVIDRDPDTEITDMIEKLSYSKFERFFTADDLNHYVFTLFF